MMKLSRPRVLPIERDDLSVLIPKSDAYVARWVCAFGRQPVGLKTRTTSTSVAGEIQHVEFHLQCRDGDWRTDDCQEGQIGSEIIEACPSGDTGRIVKRLVLQCPSRNVQMEQVSNTCSHCDRVEAMPDETAACPSGEVGAITYSVRRVWYANGNTCASRIERTVKTNTCRPQVCAREECLPDEVRQCPVGQTGAIIYSVKRVYYMSGNQCVSRIDRTLKENTCRAISNPTCGPAHNTVSASAPTSGLCSSGTASAVTLSGSTWVWTCSAPGKTPASCQARKSNCAPLQAVNDSYEGYINNSEFRTGDMRATFKTQKKGGVQAIQLNIFANDRLTAGTRLVAFRTLNADGVHPALGVVSAGTTVYYDTAERWATRSFTYTLRDTCGQESTATVTLHVKQFLSPLVLDFGAKGLDVIPFDESGARFDLTGDGRIDAVAWISGQDAFLVYDRNDNKLVDNVHELFGTAGGHANGFLALATLDGNGDGILDDKDEAFAKLQLWFDRNIDGISEPGELRPLSDLVKSINLKARKNGQIVAGQPISHSATYVAKDGKKRDIHDIWFETMELTDEELSFFRTFKATDDADEEKK